MAKSNELIKDNSVQMFENALESEDNKALAQAIADKFGEIKDELINKYEELKDVQDANILASRGVYQLTDEEKRFYDSLFKNDGTMGNNPSVGATKVIPKTIVERVFEDLKNADQGVTGLVDLQNTTGSHEWMVAVAEKPVAAWGDISDAITHELSVGFKVFPTISNKLSCFMPYSQDIIALGYSWQDAYVRAYLTEAMRSTLSIAFVSGTGVKQPWGMIYDYNVDTDQGTIKQAQAITELSPAAFGPLMDEISKNPMGFRRDLADLTLIVDASTYYSYIYPANFVLGANGNYVTVLDQLGIKLVVTETGLTKGKAVLGLPKRYAGQVAFGGKDGRIEFSDEALFLEDKRLYKTKTFADGFAKDNKAFAYLDVTGLAA